MASLASTTASFHAPAPTPEASACPSTHPAPKALPPPRPPKIPTDAESSLPPNEPHVTAVVLHPRRGRDVPYDPAVPEPPAPRPRTPPHRRRPSLKPKKGILKPPPPPQPKFSFKRDVLAPVSSKLGYADVNESPLGAVMNSGSEVQAAAVGWVGSAWKRLGAAAAAERAKMEGQMQAQVQAMQARGIQVPPSLMGKAPGSGSGAEGAPKEAGAARGAEGQRSPTPGPPVPGFLRRGSTDPFTASPTGSAFPPPLPGALAAPALSVTTLKKVHFTMSDLKVVYPFSNTVAPSVEADIKSRVESAHRQKRKSRRTAGGETKGWTTHELENLYDECCRTREEGWGLARVRQALKDSAPAPPKALDLTGVQLTLGAVEVLGDLLSVDFGLRKLVLEGCGLEDELLKPLLHSLLVSGSLPTLSLADNRKLKAKGWKYVAIFIRKAQALRYLDLSDNLLDRRAVEYLVQALAGVDDYSSLASLSPSLSGPSASAPVSPALVPMPLPTPKDATATFPPSYPAPNSLEGSASPSERPAPDLLEAERLFSAAPLLQDLRKTGFPSGPRDLTAAAVMSLRLENCGLKNPALEALAHGVRASKLKHISLRRNRISPSGAVALAVMIRDWPASSASPFGPAGFDEFIASGSTGVATGGTDGMDRDGDGHPRPSTPQLVKFESSNSVTARQSGFGPPPVRSVRPPEATPSATAGSPAAPPQMNGALHDDDDEDEAFGPEKRSLISQSVDRESKRAAEARHRLRRQIDPLPRIGTLLTLDVKSNEIKHGVTYITQVLKRNRTLRVLNLSDNKIDVAGLVALADALRYNTTLETLDLSRNPCCGPGIEGILALRSACTVNSTLKRLFLNATDLSSEGAISLAEFLPELGYLIHLDLTENLEIDIAGLMALAVSVKMNTSLRCLDVNIPPNDPEFARLSQDILQSCARNTEIAQAEAVARGVTAPVSAPMLKSTVARELNTRQEQKEAKEKRQAKREEEFRMVLVAVEESHEVLFDIVKEDESKKTPDGRVMCSDLARELLDQAKANQIQLLETMKGMKIGELKDRATTVNDQLAALITRADVLYSNKTNAHRPTVENGGLLSPRSSIDHGPDTPTSPSFSITDDDTSDEDGSAPLASEHPSPRGSRSSKAAELKLSTSGAGEGSPPIGSSEPLSPKSPVESVARGMLEEEGEVFRKGTALGVGAEVMEDEEGQGVSGEALKETILEADIARSPRASLSSPPASPALTHSGSPKLGRETPLPTSPTGSTA